MMKRTNHAPEFKAQGAREAIREEMTLSELSKKYGVHATQISTWKRAAIENMVATFGRRGPDRDTPSSAVQGDGERGLDAVLKILAPPEHHAFNGGARRIGTGLDPCSKLGQLRGHQPPGAVRNRSVHQPGETLGVVAMHPVPERLTVHPAGLGRRCTVDALQHQRASIRRAARASCPSPREAPSPSISAA